MFWGLLQFSRMFTITVRALFGSTAVLGKILFGYNCSSREVVTHTLSLCIGEGKGGEGGEREGGVALPVLHRDPKGEAEQGDTVRQGELRMVFTGVPAHTYAHTHTHTHTHTHK